MLIYTPYRSSRLQYALSILLEDLDQTWRVTNDLSEYDSSEEVKWIYGTDQRASRELVIPCKSKLWQDDIQKIDTSFLFEDASGPDFDFVSAIFYVITRYEEYLPNELDSMGRFKASSSVLYPSGLHRTPAVDQWRQQFRNMLHAVSPSLKWKTRSGSDEVTIDVDSAYAYKHKGVYRSVGGLFKDAISFQWNNAYRRIATWINGSDKYDTYAFIQEATKNKSVLWFFLLADFGAYDKNVPHTSSELRGLIRALGAKFPIGIHPGVASHDDISILKMEKERLEEILGKQVTQSRQHYLLIKPGETYRRLIQSGISHDYSMGFFDDVGFRAGTGRSYKWFDLERNEITALTIHPFQVMDVTLQRYLGLVPSEAVLLSKQLKSATLQYGGVFRSIFHNETLTDIDDWKGWRDVWQALMKD